MGIRAREVEALGSTKERRKRNIPQTGKRLDIEMVFTSMHFCKGIVKKMGGKLEKNSNCSQLYHLVAIEYLIRHPYWFLHL